MTTQTLDTSTLTGRPLVVPASSTGYARYKVLCPNVATSGPDSVATVTVNTPGTLFTGIPIIGFTSLTGSGAAAFASVEALTADITAPGTGVVAGTTTLTFIGGTFTTASIATVDTTQVVSATITAPGTGGTNGTQTVTGTTGTGTKFQASVTIADGGITAVLSITVAGSYTVNPTAIAAEPVTGAGLTGAQLNVVMGALTATVSTAGRYSVLATAPVSTTGSGGAAGVTVTPTYGVDIITVTAGGANYATAPGVTFTGGSGSGATATAVLATADDPVTVHLDFSANPLPTSTYGVSGIANQAAVLSSANKATTGVDVTVTPLSGGTLVAGTMDVVLDFTF